MPPTVATTEPKLLTAGDSWWWDRDISDDYPPADGWALAYTLVGPSAAPLAIPTTAVGSVFQVRQAATASAALPGGTYTLTGRVTLAADTFEVYRATVHVRADPAAATTNTSHAEAMVAALEAAELTLATQPRASIQINGRTVEFRSLEDVRKSLAYYRRELEVERTGSIAGPSMAVHFRRPS